MCGHERFGCGRVPFLAWSRTILGVIMRRFECGHYAIAPTRSKSHVVLSKSNVMPSNSRVVASKSSVITKKASVIPFKSRMVASKSNVVPFKSRVVVKSERSPTQFGRLPSN